MEKETNDDNSATRERRLFEDEPDIQIDYPTGWRLWVITIGYIMFHSFCYRFVTDQNFYNSVFSSASIWSTSKWQLWAPHLSVSQMISTALRKQVGLLRASWQHTQVGTDANYNVWDSNDLAFMPIWTKISNIIGRKRTFVAALVVFLAFSLGCGLSQKMNHL